MPYSTAIAALPHMPCLPAFHCLLHLPLPPLTARCALARAELMTASILMHFMRV